MSASASPLSPHALRLVLALWLVFDMSVNKFVDAVKQINDSLGHGVGDELIKQAAHRLKQFVYGEETVARLGGDEFVVLLDYLTEEADAVGLANRILSSFREPFRFNGRDYVVSISIGIVNRWAPMTCPAPF